MTERERRLPPVDQPLSKENATGNGTPSTADLIRVSNTLIGSVDQLRLDMGDRFASVEKQIGLVDTKVDLIDGRIVRLETRVVVDAAVATTKATLLATQHKEEQDRAATFQTATLTGLQRKGLVVAIVAGIGVPFLVAVLDLAGHTLGGWR